MPRRNTAGNQDDERFIELNNRLKLLMRATENLLEERHRKQANLAARPQDPDVTRQIAQFRPLTYNGCADPKKLENWIREFEKIFDVVGCPNIMKVSQASFYFMDEADLWWVQNRERFSNQVGFSWEFFTTAVRKKFKPMHLKKKLTQEFVNLSIGSITVDE